MDTTRFLLFYPAQHKTETMAILTGFDHSLDDIDLFVYLNECGSK